MGCMERRMIWWKIFLIQMRSFIDVGVGHEKRQVVSAALRLCSQCINTRFTPFSNIRHQSHEPSTYTSSTLLHRRQNFPRLSNCLLLLHYLSSLNIHLFTTVLQSVTAGPRATSLTPPPSVYRCRTPSIVDRNNTLSEHSVPLNSYCLRILST